ncbi:MAG: hypothetical protein E7496_07600 [Ruminococcus sp.]|nr:hypothetical protein [Ruminococcus sp.]
MKKTKYPDLSVLKKADAETLEKISETCPVLNQKEQNRLFQRSQTKYRIRRLSTEEFAETETFEAEPIKRTINFVNIGAAVACFLVCTGTVGGGIWLMKHPQNIAVSQSAEQLASETNTETSVSETIQTETTLSETIQTTPKLKELITTETVSTTAESFSETQMETTVPETSGTSEKSVTSPKTTTVQTAEPEPTETKTPEQTETSQIRTTSETTSKTTVQTTVTTAQEIPAVITEPEPSETMLETTEEPPAETTPEPPTELLTEPMPEHITFKTVQCIREHAFEQAFENLYSETGSSFKAVVITSHEELEELLSELIPAEATEKYPQYVAPTYQKFSKYDDAFFAEYDLLVVLKEEGSGSFWHEVQGISVDSENNCTVTIDRHMPETCTEDMAYWAICIETEKQIEQMNSVSVKFNDIMHSYNW